MQAGAGWKFCLANAFRRLSYTNQSSEVDPNLRCRQTFVTNEAQQSRMRVDTALLLQPTRVPERVRIVERERHR